MDVLSLRTDGAANDPPRCPTRLPPITLVLSHRPVDIAVTLSTVSI